MPTLNTPLPTDAGAGHIVSPWLDTDAAASYLTASPKTLAVWRSQGKGPRFHVAGGRLVRYHIDDLDAFIRGESDR